MMVTALAGVFVTFPAFAKHLLRATPPQMAGPFYPINPLLDDDNDLTRVAGRTKLARGEITELSGRILDVNARAIQGARVEIWQCDANGRYRHPHDPGRSPLDESFQGYGHALTDDVGRYRFRTIRPVPYPGRTPHIHMAVLLAGATPFVTQLYVRDEPRNQGDFLFSRIPVEQRQLVTAPFVPGKEVGVDWRADFDVVLGHTPRA
ncbi:MAG: protocatechuate 3,4-dioxygenase [Gammaproteobacteria bacterium]